MPMATDNNSAIAAFGKSPLHASTFRELADVDLSWTGREAAFRLEHQCTTGNAPRKVVGADAGHGRPARVRSQ